MNSVQVIVSAFVASLVAAVEENVLRRVLEVVKSSGGYTMFSGSAASGSMKVRAPRVKQLCPVPGCRGLAAPIFGMVCGEHRYVAKLKIARYRAERRAVCRGDLAIREWGRGARSRRPRAKQLCLVSGCTGLAAPIFGMVCGEHRDVARSKIARYRTERKTLAARDRLRAAELSV